MTCTCRTDPTALCPVHQPRPERITVQDLLAGCQCVLDDELDTLMGRRVVIRSVICPIHGAAAFRHDPPSK